MLVVSSKSHPQVEAGQLTHQSLSLGGQLIPLKVPSVHYPLGQKSIAWFSFARSRIGTITGVWTFCRCHRISEWLVLEMKPIFNLHAPLPVSQNRQQLNKNVNKDATMASSNHYQLGTWFCVNHIKYCFWPAFHKNTKTSVIKYFKVHNKVKSRYLALPHSIISTNHSCSNHMTIKYCQDYKQVMMINYPIFYVHNTKSSQWIIGQSQLLEHATLIQLLATACKAPRLSSSCQCNLEWTVIFQLFPCSIEPLTQLPIEVELRPHRALVIYSAGKQENVSTFYQGCQSSKH